MTSKAAFCFVVELCSRRTLLSQVTLCKVNTRFLAKQKIYSLPKFRHNGTTRTLAFSSNAPLNSQVCTFKITLVSFVRKKLYFSDIYWTVNIHVLSFLLEGISCELARLVWHYFMVQVIIYSLIILILPNMCVCAIASRDVKYPALSAYLNPGLKCISSEKFSYKNTRYIRICI